VKIRVGGKRLGEKDWYSTGFESGSWGKGIKLTWVAVEEKGRNVGK